MLFEILLDLQFGPFEHGVNFEDACMVALHGVHATPVRGLIPSDAGDPDRGRLQDFLKRRRFVESTASSSVFGEGRFGWKFLRLESAHV